MEARFGHDFGRVRVHAGERAAESARLVRATAYTVGDHIVLGASAPSPATVAGRRLLAHELAHTLQQRRAVPMATISEPLPVGREDDRCEREADALAAGVIAGRPAHVGSNIGGLQVQRVVEVNPAAAAADVLSHFNRLCPGQFVASGSRIQPNKDACRVSSNQSCECTCDTASDASRKYTINVQAASGSSTAETLHDGSTAAVPDTSLYPATSGGPNPSIDMVASAGSNVEFGFFGPAGRPVWYDNWRILAHELCGHGRLHQTYAGSRGCRTGHDTTIDTENAIAAEHGRSPRGHFRDPRQGEAFWNPVGDRSKVAFRQCNGLHFEAP